MKMHKLFVILLISIFLAGCGAQGPKTVSSVTSSESSSSNITSEEVTEETQSSYDFPSDVKAAKDVNNRATLENSATFSSCIYDALVHVGSPSVRKISYASIDIHEDEVAKEIWDITVYVSTDDCDYSLFVVYFLKSDDSRCCQVANWDNDHVYWVYDLSLFTGTLYDYKTDSPISSYDEDSSSSSSSAIDGVVVDYRGKFKDDVTENWRLSTVVTSKPIEDYAFDYYKAYFNNDNEIHWIINYADNTTSRINCMDGYLFVSTYSHVDGEENSAKEIGGGSFISDCTLSAKDGKPADF